MLNNWIEVSLGDICINKTDTCKDLEKEEIERYVGLEHLEPQSLSISSWGHIKEGTTFTKLFYPGQVLFGKRRSYQKKAAIADFKGVCSGDILVLEAREEKIIPQILPYIIQNDSLFDFAVGTSSGSLSPRTSWKHLSTYKLKIPENKDEQKKIVNTFQKIDLAINLKEKLITKTEKYKKKLVELILNKGIGHTNFKDTELGTIPIEWEVKSIKDIGVLKGGSGFKEKYQGSKGKEYPFYKVSDMNTPGNERYMSFANHTVDEKDLKELKANLLAKDSIVFAKVGAALLLNRRRILTVDSCIDNNMMALTLNPGYDCIYFYYLMTTIDFKELVNGGTIPSINQEQIGSLKILVPPLSEQKQISGLLTSLDEQIESFIEEKNMKIVLKKELQSRILSPSEEFVDAV